MHNVGLVSTVNSVVYQPADGGLGAMPPAPTATAALRRPAAGERIEVTAGALEPAAIEAFARHASAHCAIGADGRITLMFDDGGIVVLPWSAELAALATAQPAIETPAAAGNSSALDDVLAGADGQVGELTAPDGQTASEAGAQAAGSDFGDIVLQGHSGSVASGNSPLGQPLGPIGGVGAESSRLGRDGLKHGEMGSAGQPITTGLGQGLGHLTGLGDESIGRRNGEQISTSENHTFPGETTDVGVGIDHLWLLGSTEYLRSSSDEDVEAVDPLAELVGASSPPPRLVAQAPSLFSLAGSVVAPEDGKVATPIKIVLANPGAETLLSLIIKSPPAGTVIDWNHALTGKVETLPNGDIRITGTTSQIEDVAASLSVTPPANMSGVLALTFEATVSGFGTTATASLPYSITVTPVADAPNVTGDVQTTTEDHAVLLPNLAGHLNDLDGSEVLGFQIRGVPAGSSFQSGHVSPTDATVWIFTPAEISAGVTFVPTTDSTTTAFMKIRAIATEQANGDSKFVEDDIVVYITPLNGPHITTTAAQTNEDTQVAIGSHITATVIDPDGSERMVGIVIGNVPEAATLAYTTPPGIRVVVNDPAHPTQYTIEADPGYAGPPLSRAQIEQGIKDTLATVKVTPPHDSDADMHLSITVNTHDTDGSDYSKTATLDIAVHAVADVPEGSGAGTGPEDTFVKVPITVAPADKDGSETLEYVEISGVPSTATIQWRNADGSPNTSGTITIDPSTGTIRITGTTAEIEARALALQIKPALNTDDDFTLSVKVGSIESNPTEAGDVALLRNSLTFNVPVTVAPVADPVTLGGSSIVVEDHTVNFGAQITLAKTDTNSVASSGPSSETITTVVIHDVPAAATVTYTAATGIRVVATATSFTVEADPAYAGPALTPTQLETAIRTTVASFNLTPPLNSDLDITLKLDVTTVDRFGTAEASAPLVTANLPFVIAVKADADPATLTLDPLQNAGLEDQPIHVGFTVGRTDTDPSQATPSEAIQTVVIRDIPAGFTLSTSPTTAANAVLLHDNGDGTFTVTGPDLAHPVANEAAINDVLSHLVLTPTPNGPRQNLDDDFTLHADVTTKENNLDGGQVENLTNTTTFAIPITVAPVADPVTLPASSSVVEDHVAGVGAAIEAGLVKADQNSTLTAGPSSESITALTISGIPGSGAQSVAAIAYPGDGTVVAQAHVTASYDAVAGTLSLTLQAGGSEQDLRDALKAVTLTPHHNSDVDIPLTVAVTTVDRWGTAEASAPLVTSLPHTVIVIADATGDQPSVTGAASGVEDHVIALPVTVTMQDTDGSETLSKVELTGIPHGAGVTWTGLPAGATATAVIDAVTGDTTGWTFRPASTSYADTQALQTFLDSKLSVTPPPDSDVDFDLTVNAFAGTGEKGFSGDGGPAKDAKFGGVFCVSFDPDKKNLYITDLDNKRIRKIDMKTEIVTTVAGNGKGGVPKDGEDALTQPLVDPRAHAVDKDGNIWILERGGHALRVVDAKGKIRTVAGTGKSGMGTGKALDAALNGPKHLCIDKDGSVLIADTENHRVVRFSPKDGTITAVAGTGKKGNTLGDGDPLKAEFNQPHGVIVHPKTGDIYISDASNGRVLKVVREP